MLKRYNIIALDDLRRAAETGTAYCGEAATVSSLRPPEVAEKWRRTPCGASVAELGARQACEIWSGAEGSRTPDL
jgi:hypothetical protein